MNNKQYCRAEHPATCKFHGVPRPPIKERDIRKELKAVRKQFAQSSDKRVSLAAMTSLMDRERVLSLRLDLVTNKPLHPLDKEKAYADLTADRKAYQREVVKEILGAGTPEHEAYVNKPKTVLADKSFPYTTTEYDDFSRTFVAEKNQRIRDKAEAWAKSNGYDGVQSRKTGVFAEEYVPYKNVPGEMPYQEWRELMDSTRVFKASLVAEKASRS
jgi:hypothetical protein